MQYLICSLRSLRIARGSRRHRRRSQRKDAPARSSSVRRRAIRCSIARFDSLHRGTAVRAY